MPVAKVQLINGAFQDSEGNVLAGGYLKMKLNQDGVVNSSQICAGIEVTITLDSAGNVASSSSTPVAANQYVWGNDQLSPANSFYEVTGYKANGQPAWGPNNQQVTGNGGTFDVSTWVPNQVISWTPPLQPLVLQTNETPNGNQLLLDLHAGSNVTLTDNGLGRVTVASTTPAISLQTNETPNGSQTLLDLHAGTGVSLTDNGSGRVTIANTAAGPTFATGTPETGDTWRYNIYGDSKWDMAIGVPRFAATYAGESPASPVLIGTNASVAQTCFGGTPAAFNSSGTEPYGVTLASNNSARAAISIGVNFLGGQPGPCYFPFGSVRRMACRLLFNQTTNIRYWIGIGNNDSGSTDMYGDAPVVSVTGGGYETYSAFRFSAGTDTTIKAICGTSNGSIATQTVVDTLVAPSTTASKLFEVAVNGTNSDFYIDGVLVASIASALTSTNLVRPFWWGDNQNTANVASATWFDMRITFK